MNCANHPSNPVAHYCRTCGKPLCSVCSRDVMGVIYCENCLAARLHGTQPPASGFVSSSTTTPSSGPIPTSTNIPGQFGGPNPAVAGVLSGFFPFGVGA